MLIEKKIPTLQGFVVYFSNFIFSYLHCPLFHGIFFQFFIFSNYRFVFGFWFSVGYIYCDRKRGITDALAAVVPAAKSPLRL